MHSNRALFASLVVVSSIAFAAGCGDSTSSGGGGAGAGGGGDTGGAGGGAGGSTNAIEAPLDTWTWVDFPESKCMDGSPTGIAVNLHDASPNVVIFLEGGNACFNNLSCLSTANPNGYSKATFESDGLDAIASYPYLDRDNPDNPFKDMSLVYIPYCSGDLHFGNKADVEVGNKVRQFHGYANMTAYLERLVPTFPDADRVVLSGISAGGFGAALNYDHVAQAFGTAVKTDLVDDCGPPMSSDFIPTCLQQHLADTWGLFDSFPAGCADCGAAPFVEPYVDYILSTYPDRSIGLISSEADETISNLLGFGEDNCSSIDSAPLPYDAAKYKAGLEDLRDRIGAAGNFRLFLIPGTEHVFLNNPIGSVSVDGTALEDWITQDITEDAAWENVPAP